ncbi:TPA: DUF905 family protein [Escherichia coli]
MSDNRSRHDRLAVRLSLIISRLMAGESLSLKTLSDEFGVIRNAEGQLRWRCWNFESDAGKQLNSYLASEGILRQ